MISAAIPRASAGIVMAVVSFMAVPANAQSLHGFGLPDRGASPVPPASTVAKRKKLIRAKGADSRSIISDELTAKYGFSLGMSMQQLYVQGGWNAPSSSGLNTLGLRPADQPNISLLFDGPGSKGHLRAATVIKIFEAPADTESAPCNAEFAALKNIAEKATLAEEPRGEEFSATMEKLEAEINGASSQDKPFLLERRDMLISEHDTGLKQLAIAGALGTSYSAYSGAGLRYVIRQAYGGSMLPHKCETSLTLNISN